jgi:hypothetical protein
MSLTGNDSYDTETSVSNEDGADLSGDGGGALPIFKDDRSTQLDKIDRTSAPLVNEGEYEFPNALLAHSPAYDVSPSQGNGERFTGTSIYGSAFGADGNGLSGEARIKRGDTIVEEQEVSLGQFSVTASPPDNIPSGNDVIVLGPLSGEFKPSSGVPSTVSDLQTGGTEILAIYGVLKGTVTDYNGNPVNNVKVSGNGFPTNTDRSGNYRLNAPGGVGVTLEAIGIETTINIQEGQEETFNIQYSGLEVKVESPSGRGLVNAPVSLGGKFNRTDDEGKVLFERAPITSSEVISAYEQVENQVTTAGQGELKQSTISAGVAIIGQALDDNRAVSNVDVRLVDEQGEEYVARSTEGGNFGIGAISSGNITLVVSRDDRRYAPTEKEYDISQGEEIEEDPKLVRERNVGTM